MKNSQSKLLISGILVGIVALVGSGVLAHKASAGAPPTVTGIAPVAGPATGGTVVVIAGTGFTSTSTVQFGATTTAFSYSSSTSLTATSTAGTGTVDITVTSANGTSSTSTADQFTFIPVGSGPAAVNLLSAGNFVILAKTTITDVPPSPIVGNIGLSPATGAGIGVTCAEMTGTIFEVDAAYTGGGGGSTTCAAPGTAGTGSNKTLVDDAVGDMLTAYTAAAGISSPTETELGAGNISGMTLPPGLYKWSTGVNINSDVYLSGSASAVWVFQISGDLTVASGAHVVLEGGALAKTSFGR
jgi:hypothetical protein